MKAPQEISWRRGAGTADSPMALQVHIVNLSIGGPDSADKPFMRKVGEAAAAGIIVVSGIGNSGPLWGSLMNPADMTDVLGVGGVNDDHSLSDFSSRGMTIWELPDGYGRVKPDVLTYASRVMGLSTTGGCRALSGTSVACPVVTGSLRPPSNVRCRPRPVGDAAVPRPQVPPRCWQVLSQSRNGGPLSTPPPSSKW